MSRYDALTAHLQRSAEPTTVLTFATLDQLVGGLPASARRHAAWWSNSRTSHGHARAWLDAGRRASPDFSAGLVRFDIGAESIAEPRSNSASPGGASGTKPGGPLQLEVTGEEGGASLQYSWRGAGSVDLLNGKLAFPAVPPTGGVYRFTLVSANAEASAYVGESDNLARRMANYRNPGPTQATNLRMGQRLLDTLSSGGSVQVAVVLDVDIDGATRSLTDKAARRMIENLVLVKLAGSGHAVENL